MTTNTDAFNRLPFRDKLDLLYGVDAVEKRDLILGSPEAERLVRSFALESLFSTVKEIGFADAADLVALASGEQLRGVVDLDCWKKDRFDVDSLLDWLGVLVEGGNRPLGEFLNAVDLSLLVFFLKSFVRIRRKEDPEEPFEDLEGGEVFELDEHYEIGFHRWDARAPLVRQLLEELYERDYGYFVTVMEEIWWGVDSELEERSFQARNARLQDRGFPDFYEALEIYRPLAAKDLPRRETPLRMRGGEDDETIPVDRSLLLPEDVRSFFAEILSEAFAAEHGDEIRQEMAFLTNRVLVADGVDFADREAVTAAVQVTHDTLNLALESLAGGTDRRRGIERLREHHLMHLFRHGWHLLLELRRAAKRAEESLGLAPVAGEIPFLDTPYREALSAFTRPKPRYFVGLDVPGETRFRPIASLADLSRARRVIADVGALPEACSAIVGQSLSQVAALRPADADEFRASAAILTAFAHFALGGPPSLRPLEPSEIPRLRRATRDERSGKIRADVRERFAERATARGYLDACFRRFEEEFLALEPDFPVDPRYVTCLMIAVSRPAAAARP